MNSPEKTDARDITDLSVLSSHLHNMSSLDSLDVDVMQSAKLANIQICLESEEGIGIIKKYSLWLDDVFEKDLLHTHVKSFLDKHLTHTTDRNSDPREFHADLAELERRIQHTTRD